MPFFGALSSRVLWDIAFWGSDIISGRFFHNVSGPFGRVSIIPYGYLLACSILSLRPLSPAGQCAPATITGIGRGKSLNSVSFRKLFNFLKFKVESGKLGPIPGF
jgi:hypothetical protein